MTQHSSPTFRPVRFPAETEAFADFLASEVWPFHGSPVVARESILAHAREGLYTGGTREVHWIELEGEAVGIIQLLELDDLDDGDGFPLFDLRIRAAVRGRGIGGAAVRWLTGHLFARYPLLTRIEGTTRADNLAMRRVFERSLFALEGRYRESWPDASGAMHDAVRYAILRRDWESGTVTPVRWGE
ncbi:MAG: GNAT family protein [Candidatus Sumerlaeia bacterium]|nr:GNAT family protein [Candidatus Sumerlaeia bacterium]